MIIHGQLDRDRLVAGQSGNDDIRRIRRRGARGGTGLSAGNIYHRRVRERGGSAWYSSEIVDLSYIGRIHTVLDLER